MPSWFKYHHDCITDWKWDVVADRAGCTKRDVLAVWNVLMTEASTAPRRGSISSFRPEMVAVGLRWDAESVAAVFEAMRGLVHDGRRLTGWDHRQANDETLRKVRQRDYKDREQSAKYAQTHESLCPAGGTPDSPVPQRDRETDGVRRNETNGREEGPNIRLPTGERLKGLWDLLLMAGGAALDTTSTRSQLGDLSRIIGLMEDAGRGPPCDLAAHILPAIQAKCATRPPGSVWSWSYLVRPILDYRDNCLAGAPGVVIPLHQENTRGQPTGARRSRFETTLAGAAAAAGQAVAKSGLRAN